MKHEVRPMWTLAIWVAVVWVSLFAYAYYQHEHCKDEVRRTGGRCVKVWHRSGP
jgi:hypothetical protein